MKIKIHIIYFYSINFLGLKLLFSIPELYNILLIIYITVLKIIKIYISKYIILDKIIYNRIIISFIRQYL